MKRCVVHMEIYQQNQNDIGHKSTMDEEPPPSQTPKQGDFTDESSKSGEASNESSTTAIFSQHYNEVENVTNIDGNLTDLNLDNEHENVTNIHGTIQNLNLDNECGNVTNVVGNNQLNLYAPLQFKDLAECLQFGLKKRYLEKKPLQNIPWLQETKFIDDLFVELEIVKPQYLRKIFKSHNKIPLKEIFHQNKDEPRDSTNNILIEGQLGNGKTTLCWYLAREWANNREFMEKLDFVFVIPLKELKSLTIQAYIQREFLIDNLTELIKSKKVLFILDGLDKIRKTSSIFDEINEIKKKSNLSVIITSRPIEVDDHDFQSFQRMKLLGFDETGINEFIDQYFDEVLGSREIKAIKEKIFGNQCIKELAYCPLFLMLFCLLTENDSIGNKFSESEAELFKTAINFLVERQLKKNKKVSNKKLDLFQPSTDKEVTQYFNNFQNFGCLALKNLKEKKLNFNEEEIQEFNCELLLKLGLLSRIDTFDKRKCYQMIRLSFSEFLISFYLKNLYSVDKTVFESKMKDLVTILYEASTVQYGLFLNIKRIFQNVTKREYGSRDGITKFSMSDFSLNDSMIFSFVCDLMEDKLIAATYLLKFLPLLAVMKTQPISKERLSFLSMLFHPTSVDVIDKKEGIEKVKQKIRRCQSGFCFHFESSLKLFIFILFLLLILNIVIKHFFSRWLVVNCRLSNRTERIYPNGTSFFEEVLICEEAQTIKIMKFFETISRFNNEVNGIDALILSGVSSHSLVIQEASKYHWSLLGFSRFDIKIIETYLDPSIDVINNTFTILLQNTQNNHHTRIALLNSILDSYRLPIEFSRFSSKLQTLHCELV